MEKMIGHIKMALQNSPRQDWTAELHLQIIKHAEKVQAMTGKEFCKMLDIPVSYGTEFAKMRKIAKRLVAAGLDVTKI